ncbi:tRNA (adenosine(37)-N6)-threonylcarbamoyltransferase complex transferase subunit TsaD [Oceanicella sp. SM1341]|uniref:tRNA (adenosine(37)-N6)-threonylcarbamoyltransferase complex transferase subunit TsaD n=1 Tax=Oceanicella sp. SM1341 TaxID=1548889 RepID=UPI000E4D8CDB|nr:tRNA (adenosine(37)-N6)-threonylcarbamoyltransferase complex transferase subunit TsaD [Oceanicella sp. SM1341]
MDRTLTLLGLESSCDDTAAAVVRGRPGGAGEILSSVVSGQAELHADFGGVVPEIAARAHAERLDLCVERALEEAGLSLADVDAIAVTAGPGLIGGVVSGVMCAKGLAAGAGLPLIGVNHLSGHALTPRLTDGLAYPYLMLLVSGGHCQFLAVEGPDSFRRLGGTIDDAPGEAFDKVAKMLALGYPGGPAVEREAAAGDAARFAFPRPLLDRPDCDFSFSGLKTAVRRARDRIVAEKGGLTVQDRADLCAGFQQAVAEVVAEKTRRACRLFAQAHGPRTLAVAGGVAANAVLRAALTGAAEGEGFGFLAPPLRLCTDNGAMIAWAGLEQLGLRGPDDMALGARPRWPLDAAAAAMLGSGRKGAKA